LINKIRRGKNDTHLFPLFIKFVVGGLHLPSLPWHAPEPKEQTDRSFGKKY